MSYTKQRIRIRSEEVYGLFRYTFAPMDVLALGLGVAVATGLLFGLVVTGAVFANDYTLTESVGLLSQYFYGVEVSLTGAAWAGFGGFLMGFSIGLIFAAVRNAAVAVLLGVLRLTSYSFALSEDIND